MGVFLHHQLETFLTSSHDTLKVIAACEPRGISLLMARREPYSVDIVHCVKDPLRFVCFPPPCFVCYPLC